ncbi:DUF6544 family protein [Gaopeijia maritima]|uniref:DUF6544 family protein n=1 Tax=Gaopeijia maritima TaxID=3119007 RepID=UPI003255AAF1
MSVVFALLTAVHGLIHLMGPAKAFGWAELPELTDSISPGMGVVWLFAAVSMLVTAVLVATSSRYWWVAALVAVALSQAVVFSAWGDARWGTIANALILIGGLFGFLSEGPSSLRAEYRRAVQSRLVDAPMPSLFNESGLHALPDPVAEYLRRTGVPGRPVARHARAEWRGRIRSSPTEDWMEFTAEQYNFPAEPARFFFMKARRGFLPVDVLHVFENGHASMRVQLLSAVPLVHAQGPEMTQAETVTLLNDMLLFIPSALGDSDVRARLRWDPVDRNSARVFYRLGANEVSAELVFNDRSELVDFVSDDRFAASSDGSEFVQWRWSTPVHGYRDFNGLTLMSRGEGLWHAPDGTFPYIELELTALEVNGAAR